MINGGRGGGGILGRSTVPLFFPLLIKLRVRESCNLSRP